MAKGTHDEPRLLAQRSEIGYTERLDRALVDEPEAVSAIYQRALTEDAERSRDAGKRVAWVSARDEIKVQVATLSGSAYAALQSDLRVILRQLDRIDQRLAT